MIILNVIILVCLILVEGDEIPTGEESTASNTDHKNDNKPQSILEMACTSALLQEMTVKGFDIKLSDIVGNFCWNSAVNIQIFAQNKIIIDRDIIRYGGQLSMYAPTWETIETRKIIVSGKNGEPHKPSTVRGIGKTGEPGLPGDAGGIFIGVGEHLINASNLTIEANGGNGGPGQNGAKGISGIDGEDFKEDFKNINMSPEDFEIFLNDKKINFTETSKADCSAYGCVLLRKFYFNGKMANTSGDGGDGGAGGLGGPAGFIYMSGFDTMPNVERDEGKNGTAGNGGFAGYPARNGRNLICHFTQSPTFVNLFYSKCDRSASTWGPKGKHGIDGGNEINIKEPPIAMNIKYADLMNSFKQYVRENLVNSGKLSDATGFIDKL